MITLEAGKLRLKMKKVNAEFKKSDKGKKTKKPAAKKVVKK